VADDIDRSERILCGVEPGLSFRGSEASKWSSRFAEPTWALSAAPALEATVMLPIAAAIATARRAATKICWRHSRRNMRHAQRTRARRAATPPFLDPRSVER